MAFPSPQISFLYSLVRLLADWFFTTFHDFSTSGKRHVPLHGKLLLTANHASFYDPPAIGCRLRRPIHYFARDTLYRGWFGKGLLAIGTIPVARDQADIKSLKAIFKALGQGGAVAIYPEGTRSHDGQLMAPKAGAGMIACKSGAPVVPVRLFGTYEAYSRHRKFPTTGGTIHIVYGRPMTANEIDPGKAHPERYLEASRRIMKAIAGLKPPKEIVV